MKKLIFILLALSSGCTLPKLPSISSAKDACLQFADVVKKRDEECAPLKVERNKQLYEESLDICDKLAPNSNKNIILDECIPDMEEITCEQLRVGYYCQGIRVFY